MTRRRHVVPLAVLVAAAGANHATGQDLAPGAPAPQLEIREWLKGDPITTLDAGATYVVEFWATWCGPCIESIPELSRLAKQHADVTFLGVSVLEDASDGAIRRFVDRMGDKMAYRVAYSGNKDGMARSWLQAASQDGIPTAFVVRNGVIQWIGHPARLATPLRELAAGTFDVAAAKRAFATDLESSKARKQAEQAIRAVFALREAGKKAEALEALGEAAKKHPLVADEVARLRWEWLADDDPAAWLQQAEQLAASGDPKLAQRVASFALRSAQQPATAARARVAIGLVLRAGGNDDWDSLLYARTIYLKLEDAKDALAVTSRMLELFPTSPAKDNAELRANLQKSKAELATKLGM